jgi:hypothetical protein
MSPFGEEDKGPWFQQTYFKFGGKIIIIMVVTISQVPKGLSKNALGR